MPAIDFSIPHAFEPSEVVERIKGFIAKLRERNEPKFLVKSEAWQDNTLNCSFSSYGFAMDAVMQVEPNELKFHLNIPFAAMIFKGQIEERLRGEMTKLLA
jgi:hypothetical protein